MWLILAGAWGSGVPPAFVAVGILVVINPPVGVVVTTVVAVVLARRSKRAGKVDEAAFLRSLASDVAAGMTLRSAIRAGDPAIVDARTRRLCDAGMPLASVGASVRDGLPANGATFAAVCSIAERTGSTLAATLHVLADRAVDVASMDRHRTVATAQARFSAGVVGIAPLAVTGVVVAMRGMPADGNPVAMAAIVVGAGMQLGGVAIVSSLASRSLS